MKNFTYKNLIEIIKSKGIFAVSSGLLLISCGAQMGGYTETDGVYYDPKKDVIPAGVVMDDTNNNVGEDYSYNDNSPSIIEQNQQNMEAQKNKYQDWNNFEQSDWGSYAGTETNYYSNNWGWGYGYPYGMGGYYGWGNRWSIGLGFGWGWNSWYNPGWNWGWGTSWGYPYYGYGYNPYYWDSYYWGGGYYPGYYGWGGYPGYWGRPANVKRSGADAIFRGNNTNNSSFNTVNRNGFGRNSSNQNSVNNNGFRRSGFGTPNQNSQNSSNQNSVNNNGFRRSGFGTTNNNNSSNQQQNGGFRRTESTPSQQPSYTPQRNDSFRNSGGGFRSSGGGFGGGSSSGGGMRSSGGGGMRSGGFR